MYIYIYIKFEFLETLAVLSTLEKVSQLSHVGLALYINEQPYWSGNVQYIFFPYVQG